MPVPGFHPQSHHIFNEHTLTHWKPWFARKVFCWLEDSGGPCCLWPWGFIHLLTSPSDLERQALKGGTRPQHQEAGFPVGNLRDSNLHGCPRAPPSWTSLSYSGATSSEERPRERKASGHLLIALFLPFGSFSIFPLISFAISSQLAHLTVSYTAATWPMAMSLEGL